MFRKNPRLLLTLLPFELSACSIFNNCSLTIVRPRVARHYFDYSPLCILASRSNRYIYFLYFKVVSSLLYFVVVVAHLTLIGINKIIHLHYLYTIVRRLSKTQSKDLLFKRFCQVGHLTICIGCSCQKTLALDK